MSHSTATLISTARRLFLANLLIVSVYAGVVLFQGFRIIGWTEPDFTSELA